MITSMGPHGSPPAIGTPGVTGAAAMMTADRASAGAGLEVIELGPGRAVVTMTVREDMTNGHAITHGGYVFLLADTAFACACNSEGAVTVAVGADITFLAATRAGDLLTARAERRSQRGRSGVYDVTVTRHTDDAEQVVAEFRGRSRTLRPSTEPQQRPPTDNADGNPDADGPTTADTPLEAP